VPSCPLDKIRGTAQEVTGARLISPVTTQPAMSARPRAGKGDQDRHNFEVRDSVNRMALAGCSPLSDVAASRRTNRDQIVIIYLTHCGGWQRDQRLCTSRGGHELDFQRIRRVCFHDRSKVAPLQPMRWLVVLQDHHIEIAQRHFRSPG
jgi:hypothetical protein